VTRVAVTGASRGIGRATALALAERGCEVTTVGRMSPDLSLTHRLLDQKGSAPRHIEVDLARPEMTRAAGLSLREELGLMALVHCAGIVRRSPLAEFDEAEHREQFEVNFHAPLLLTRQVLPLFLAQRRGRILFVSSISAGVATPGQASYNSSKAALDSAMRCLAEELTDTGVMTASVLPGAVDTDMLAGSGFAPRMVPEDVAKTLVFFALDASLAHNGATIEMFGV
jgi:3-oxoacyl-[acyl-carrier protein] reductase